MGGSDGPSPPTYIETITIILHVVKEDFTSN